MGMVLMAGVTSLPELATGLSAVASDLPDIAAGNILGSCVFNVFILGLLDALSTKVPLSSTDQPGQHPVRGHVHPVPRRRRA
ncbi:MAG: hypothetical protein MZV70_66555 [Desulfobacterales bacterium]|nr:hypothetical protein [Desulfobacterales bacterium]